MGWFISLKGSEKGKIRRFYLPTYALVLISVVFLVVIIGGFFIFRTLKTSQSLMAENQRLSAELNAKTNQINFLGKRMSQVRDQMSAIRNLSREVEKKLGKRDELSHIGIGGPLTSTSLRDARQMAFLSSENNLLDQMWNEIEELEL
ncbi:hypothetical protein JW979_12910, partial [bacterium]|nr:hypothetical protein [candidate division CSSED10-310 bacterium]